MTTRERILSLLADGKPRSVQEMSSDLGANLGTVRGKLTALLNCGEVEAAGGRACRPPNETTARRYTLAVGVAA